MLAFLMRIPLIRDFVILFPEALEFHERMSRKEFWKAMGGFLLSYLVIALIGEGMLYWFMPHFVHKNGALFADVWILLPLAFCLFSFLPVLAAQSRRLLDARRSRWWLLLTLVPYLGWFILMVLFLLPGRSFENGRDISAPPPYRSEQLGGNDG